MGLCFEYLHYILNEILIIALSVFRRKLRIPCFSRLYDHNHYHFQSLPRFHHGGNLTLEFVMWQLVIAECLKGLNALLKPIPLQLSFSHWPPDEDRLHMLSIEAIHSLVII